MAYERICCPKCSEDFGQEKKFLEHLAEEHGIEDALTLYLEVKHSGSHPTCICSPTCTIRLLWSGWKKGFTSKFARGHNARVDSVYLKPERQREFTEKRTKGYSEGKYTVWNDGLTKETSDTVKRSSEKASATLREGYASGEYVAWQLGKTKEDSLGVLHAAEKRNEKLRAGEINVWNKGLTKETNETLARISTKISDAYSKREMGNRISHEAFVKRIGEFSDSFELISHPSDYKRRRIDRLTFKCKACGAEQRKSLAMLEESPVCFSCAPRESAAQLELADFVRSLGPEVVVSDRTVISPKELDIWVPSARLGIEYNGLYWHSSSVLTDARYHADKSAAAAAAGVSLLSIFEDEWRDRRKIVEGMIRHRLGMPHRVEDARKLSCLVLESRVSSAFFDENHLEGSTRCSVTFGLVDSSGIPLAAMSLRRPFHRKYSGMLEVARCATATGVVVRGWLGKLTSVARSYAAALGVETLMTYVDDRVGSGRGYAAAGWKQVGDVSSPRFWWTDFRLRYNRFKYKADRSRRLSQEEVAAEAGVVPIWGCGNRTFVLHVPSHRNSCNKSVLV